MAQAIYVVLLAMMEKGNAILQMNFVRGAGVGLVALALCIVMGPVNSASAADGLDKLAVGTKVGEKIPHPLKTTDQHGKTVDFSSVTGGKGLILLFTRSLDW